MINQNYILIEINRWQKECLQFLINKNMTIEEKTSTRINIFKLNYKELSKKIKEIRKIKNCKHSPWRGRNGNLGECVFCNKKVL